MKTVIFAYGKFSNHNDLHKLIVGLSANYVNNKEFTLCEYKDFDGGLINIDNPLYVKMDERGYAYLVETETGTTLEDLVEDSPGDLILVTNFVDYKSDLIAEYIKEKINAKKLTFVYYDENNRATVLKGNEYVSGLNDSIRFEQLNRVSRRSCLVLKGK